MLSVVVFKIYVGLVPIMVAHEFFDVVFHCCRHTFVPRFLSFVPVVTVLDDGLDGGVQSRILLFQIPEEYFGEHEEFFFLPSDFPARPVVLEHCQPFLGGSDESRLGLSQESQDALQVCY